MKRTGRDMVAAMGAVTATVLVAMSAMTTEAAAREYPWCSYYNSGSQNCGFATLDQCKSNISGIGGFCQMNPSYAARGGQTSALESVLARSRRTSR
jgi:Protein of unknown function (DUF3551)